MTAPRFTAQGWQPIETAPRDGTPLLGYFPFVWGNGKAAHAIDVMAFDERIGAWYFPTPKNYIQRCEVQPTHWMPLPDSPTPSPSVTREGGE